MAPAAESEVHMSVSAAGVDVAHSASHEAALAPAAEAKAAEELVAAKAAEEAAAAKAADEAAAAKAAEEAAAAKAAAEEERPHARLPKALQLYSYQKHRGFPEGVVGVKTQKLHSAS